MSAVAVPPPVEAYADLVRRALAEDIGTGDVTSTLTVDADARARGTLAAKSRLVVAGLDVVAEVFRQCDPAAVFEVRWGDGSVCDEGDAIAIVTGTARALLSAERTALNFLQRLSGIATLTRRFVEAADDRLTVLDTRKTTPTFRELEKYAVRCGGGTNHRVRLDAGVLIKDNHKRLAGGIAQAAARAQAGQSHVPVEAEVETLDELDQALEAGVPRVLLDNFTVYDIREAVKRVAGRAKIEVSGGITLERIAELASTGVDFVSVGALTHSAPAVDISFELETA
ncbi:MAG: carboxylating nicotinate-nucleotide diphosphorylase [Acidobacteria bacterium]|nr:carboxylating nicotinate-nucleotide diphosphorylase [Acidobacteriota bacterium]